MRQWWYSVMLLGCAMACIHGAQVFDAWGGTTQTGEVTEITAMDALNATAEHQARKGFGRNLAIYGALASLSLVFAGRPGMALMGFGGGMAMGFAPGIISSTFDAAPAATATLSHAGVMTAWWAPATVVLYPGFLMLRLLQDPVFLGSLLLVIGAAQLARRRVAV